MTTAVHSELQRQDISGWTPILLPESEPLGGRSCFVFELELFFFCAKCGWELGQAVRNAAKISEKMDLIRQG